MVNILVNIKRKPRKREPVGLIDTGGSGEIRTRDQRIKSPLLYRLSYRPSKVRNYSKKFEGLS